MGSAASAKVPDPLWYQVKLSQVIVFAKPVKYSAGDAEVELLKIYKGQSLLTNALEKRLTIRDSEDRILESLQSSAIMFLAKDKRSGAFIPSSSDIYRADSQYPPRIQDIEAMLDILLLPDEKAQVQRLWNLLGDPRLSQMAQENFSYVVNGSHSPLNYRKQMMELITSPDRNRISLGLNLLQEHQVPEAIPELINLAGHYPTFAASVALALRHYQEHPEVEATLIGLTSHTNSQVRAQSIVCLQTWNSPTVALAIEERRNDPDNHVRDLANRFSKISGHDQGRDDQAMRNGWLNILSSDASLAKRAAAAEILVKSGDPRAPEAIIQQIQTHPNDALYRSLLLKQLNEALRDKPDFYRNHPNLLLGI